MRLSARNMQVYAFVRSYHRLHGYGPSIAEIAEMLGLQGRSSAHYHLTRLREAGMVAWEPGTPHSVHPVDEEHPAL